MTVQLSPASPQPVSLLSQAGQGVGDGVDVGGDVQAVQDHVVAGVDDRRDLRRVDHLHQPRQQAGRTHSTGQGHEHGDSLALAPRYAARPMRSLDLLVHLAGRCRRGRLCSPPRRPARRRWWARVGDIDRPYDWASVTKLCTALAVLVAVEETTLSLGGGGRPPGVDGGPPAGPRLGPRALGRGGARAPGPPPHLLQRRLRPAGRALGASARASPSPTTCARRCSTPSACAGRGWPPGARRPPACTARVRDLVHLAAELLSPTLVAPVTLARATAVAFPGLSGVLPGFGRQDPCDWGLGFELRDAKRPHWTGARQQPVGPSATSARPAGSSGSTPRRRWPASRSADRAFGPWAAEAWPAPLRRRAGRLRARVC